MYDYYKVFIVKIIVYFEVDFIVMGLIFMGLIVYGFDCVDFDVDVLIVVLDDDFVWCLEIGNFIMVSFDLCIYEGGFVDVKYICLFLIN